MDKLDDLHVDRKKYMIFTTMEAEGEGWDPRKASLSPPFFYIPL